MMTTLAWVVLLTAETRPLRQVSRAELDLPESPLTDAVDADRPNPQVPASSQGAGQRLGNVGIFPSYARDATPGTHAPTAATLPIEPLGASWGPLGGLR